MTSLPAFLFRSFEVRDGVAMARHARSSPPHKGCRLAMCCAYFFMFNDAVRSERAPWALPAPPRLPRVDKGFFSLCAGVRGFFGLGADCRPCAHLPSTLSPRRPAGLPLRPLNCCFFLDAHVLAAGAQATRVEGVCTFAKKTWLWLGYAARCFSLARTTGWMTTRTAASP